MGIEAKIRLGEDGFCRFCRAIVVARKSGGTGTGQTNLPPIHRKSDRLLAAP
jgi:hypothetical protein